MAKYEQRRYWHVITWINPDADPRYIPGEVGTVIGLKQRQEKWEGRCRDGKGFCPVARLALIGIVPINYHEEYPEEAFRRLELWKARYLKAHPIDGVS
jgi:hypothetical protein